jgi:hypothetical protein
MPRKVFTAGEVLAAADVNEFLQDQAVMTFAGTAARGSAIGTATEGMTSYLEDSDSYQSYNGSDWVSVVSTGAWSTYTPTLTGITLGNGVISARFIQIGKTVHFWVIVALGSTSSVTGSVQMTLPVTKSSSMGTPIGESFFHQIGVLNQGPGSFISQAGSNVVTFYALTASGSYVTTQTLSATIPFTWANTHTIGMKGTYEAA